MGKVVELDVRPYLRKKLEPFQVIMDTVKSLEKDDTFVLHATFKPTPLLTLLKTKGYRNEVKQKDKEHWIVTFTHKSQKDGEPSETVQSEEVETTECPGQVYELDNRGLEPPQPMMRTLKKLEQANTGDTVIIHNDRVPMFLIEELITLGYQFEIEEQEDGSAKVAIHKS